MACDLLNISNWNPILPPEVDLNPPSRKIKNLVDPDKSG
jgi:hypothetical protein